MTSAIQAGRNALMFSLLALAIAACGDAPAPEAQSVPGEAASPAGAEEAGAGSSTVAIEAEQPGQAIEAEVEADPETPDGFDVSSVPLSTATLGDFPYFTLPEGYRNPNRPVPVRDYDRAAVWTGDRLEWIEGRVFESLVHAERGKGWSKLEVTRNIDHQVQQAGGVQVVAESRPPKEIVQAWSDGQDYSPGRGDIYNQGASTWLVRRADRDIWVHFVGNNSSGSWMVIESAPFEPTASLLPASEMKQQLDAEGRVAIEVNFAVDEAEILPESQPQVEQVLALLREDPELSLSIEGHTDDTGEAAHNQRLSEARARSVVAALTAEGIEASRLRAQGHGQSQPVAGNDTDEGRAKNRRVELIRL